MKDWLILKIIRVFLVKIDGYKTILTGFAILFHALSGLLGALAPELIVTYHLPQMDLNQVYMEITGALGVWGLGGKLEKTKKILEKNVGS